MRLGYAQLYQKRETGRQVADDLTRASCDKVFVDRYPTRKQEWRQWPELQSLLEHSTPGDTVVLVKLDHLRSPYQVWLELVNELQLYGLELEILSSPQNNLTDWRYLFTWMHDTEERSQPSIRVKKFSKERGAEKTKYHAFSRDPYFRRVYWDIVQQVMAKRSLRQITKDSGAPLSTVVRIRKEVAKMKQTLLLIGTFLLTIISLKLAQNYSANWLIQVLICAVMTVLIIYFSYSDSRSD